jgi:predicted nuclease of restriction endonuclease-like (RecB) superfamily
LGLPSDYPELLGTIKARIQHERLSAVITANSAMVLLYWDIGRMILERQHQSGWGAKIIERLAGDLRDAYPDMKGLSPRNLKYMRAFCAAWPDRTIVQAPLAQITWYHNIALLEKVSSKADRLWYARAAIQYGWSQSVLVMQMPGAAALNHSR